MTERKSFEIQENRKEIFERDGYTCQVCGKSIWLYGTPQLAHLIAKTEQNMKRYGLSKAEINYAYNLASVCSLRCNDAMNIGNRPAEAWALVEKIRDAMLKE